MQQNIRLAHSFARDPRDAVAEFYASVAQQNMALVIFFCSIEYDLNVLAAEMNRLFAGVRVVGCTTAGEIGPSGYREHSLSGASFSSDICTAVTGYVDQLRQFKISEGQDFCQNLLEELERRAPQANAKNSFAFLLIDGLSLREEPVACAFQNALGRLPLVGGSAGDGMRLDRCHIFAEGSFRSDIAALILVTTSLPFKVFKTQHFVLTDQKLVITEADPSQRTVTEINGFPASEEYARLLGVGLRDITPRQIAASPLAVLVDGNYYVRSIHVVNPNGSLTFLCAIEEGVVLRIARSVNLAEDLEEAFIGICAEIGSPQLVLVCDCVLRKLEMLEKGLVESVGKILQRNRAVGFCTYGEQFHGLHVNQTLSGIAFGQSAREDNDV
jgi:hypothetical protein